jgi:ABC-type phosphate transport system substrate-binding protein
MLFLYKFIYERGIYFYAYVIFIITDFLFPFFGCQTDVGNERDILIGGSTSISELSKAWAEAYMKENTGTKIEILSTGSKKGIEDF